MTKEQQDLIHHIFCTETFWTKEVILQHQKDPIVRYIMDGLSIEEIYNEGLRFAQELNKKIGMKIY